MFVWRRGCDGITHFHLCQFKNNFDCLNSSALWQIQCYLWPGSSFVKALYRRAACLGRVLGHPENSQYDWGAHGGHGGFSSQDRANIGHLVVLISPFLSAGFYTSCFLFHSPSFISPPANVITALLYNFLTHFPLRMPPGRDVYLAFPHLRY